MGTHDDRYNQFHMFTSKKIIVFVYRGRNSDILFTVLKFHEFDTHRGYNYNQFITLSSSALAVPKPILGRYLYHFLFFLTQLVTQTGKFPFRITLFEKSIFP